MPWTNWSADCSSSIVAVAPDEVDEEEELEEVAVLDSSAMRPDAELEHRKAPTVAASETTEPVLPSLTKMTSAVALKGMPSRTVAAPSLKTWQTAVRVGDASFDDLLRGCAERVEHYGDLDRAVAIAGLDRDVDRVDLAGVEGQGRRDGREEGGGGGEESGGAHVGCWVGWLDRWNSVLGVDGQIGLDGNQGACGNW